MTVIPRRPVRAAIWAATAALTLFTGSVFAQADYATLVPANSAYVAHVPKAAEMWNAWKGNAIYQSFHKLMEEPEFKEKTEGFAAEVKTIEDALGFKLDGDNLSKIFGNATLYLAPGENAGETNMGFTSAIADKDRFKKILDLAEKAAVSAAKDDEESTGTEESDEQTTAPSPITTAEHNGVSYKRFSSEDESQFFYALAGDLFVAAGSEDEIKALIDRTKGKAEGTLSTKAEYKAAQAALAAQPGELYFYNDAKAGMELQQSQPGMEKFRELLRKVVPVTYTATSVKIEPKQITSYSHAPLAEGEAAELLKKNPGTTPLEIVRFAPKDSLLVFGTSLLAADLYYNILQEALGAAGTDTDQFEQQMQALEQTLGFSVKNDLIPALGNEFALIISSFQMSGTTPAVKGAVAFKVADKTKLAKVTAGIDKLAAQMGGGSEGKKGGLKETKIGGSTAKTMEIPGVPAYSPGYVVAGDYFLIGSSLEALRDALGARQDEAKSLASTAVYKRMGPTVTTTGNSFQFFNFSGLWETVRAFTAFAGENAQSAAKIVDALKVIDAFGGSSSVKDNAVVSQGIIVLGGGAAPAEGSGQ